MRRIVALAGLLLLAGALRAQDAPVGEAQPDAPVRDVEFGVTVRQFGLERHVEMLQWEPTPNGFARVWSDEPIDASRFDPAHANPVGWPLPGRRWLARSATLDGKPLDADVVATLGEWRDFRPSFNALPGNMHSEWFNVAPALVEQARATRARGGRVVAVGTTVVRALESALRDGELQPFAGETAIFIYPGYRIRSVDALLTNFHLPESTLLMLVSAFAGRERILAAYAHAVRERYRFFSYGDAMLLWPQGARA